MIVRKKDRRLKTATLNLVLFVGLLCGIYSQLPIINWIDEQGIYLAQLSNLTITSTYYYVWVQLTSPLMVILYTVLLCVVLYLIRWQIPALWVLVTLISGLAVGLLLRTVIQRPRPLANLTNVYGFSFPGVHVLGVILLGVVIYTILLPHFRDRGLAWLCGFLVVVVIINAMLANIYYDNLRTTDVIGAYLLANTWAFCLSAAYRKYADKVRRSVKAWRHSNI